MSMTSQGFPLWAVESDGTPHIVVGWDEHGYPHTVPASAPSLGLADFPDGTWFTFTTTDPSAPERRVIGADDLRQRMAGLADRLEQIGYGPHVEAATMIRDELSQ